MEAAVVVGGGVAWPLVAGPGGGKGGRGGVIPRISAGCGLRWPGNIDEGGGGGRGPIIGGAPNGTGLP